MGEATTGDFNEDTEYLIRQDQAKQMRYSIKLKLFDKFCRWFLIVTMSCSFVQDSGCDYGRITSYWYYCTIIFLTFQSLGSNKAAIVMPDPSAQRQLQETTGSLQRGQPSRYLLYSGCQSELFRSFSLKFKF